MSRSHRPNNSYATYYNSRDRHRYAPGPQPYYRGNSLRHSRRSSLSTNNESVFSQQIPDDAQNHIHSIDTVRYSPTTRMFANAKPMYSRQETDRPCRHSHAPHMVVARRHTGSYTSHADISDEEPPSHARMAHSKRHSTFPPSAYYSSHSKQVQPYQQRYVHPAIPPTSPLIESLPGPRHNNKHKRMVVRSDAEYEQPRYTYQPPQFDDHHRVERPAPGRRSDSWSHSSSSAQHSRSRPPSRHSSVPPSALAANGRHRDYMQGPPDDVWGKAKDLYRSKTASNTAEIAMFGLLALSKAL